MMEQRDVRPGLTRKVSFSVEKGKFPLRQLTNKLSDLVSPIDRVHGQRSLAHGEGMFPGGGWAP